MTHARIAWTAMVAALTLACAALGQVTPPGGPGTAPAATSPGNSAPAATTAPATQSAAEILQGLMNNTPTALGATTMGSMPLIIPEGPSLGADGLLREGQQLEMRGGHLKKEGAMMMFVFDEKEKPAYPAMGVVPSKRLASMEDAAGFGENPNGSDMNFRITAEVTQYRGKNYLYIKPSGIPVPPPAKPVPPGRDDPLVVPAAPNVPVTAPLPQGDVIARRVGRLVKDSKTGLELIAFDADGKLMADPPMGVIPCQYLAVMEDATDYGNKPLKFIVSGEVTTYRGKNYLYLKFAKVVTDLNGGIGSGETLVTPGATAPAAK